ncbi:fungal-specific transcription factor domain-containing protein [Zopfochytrium polystomum]|nr:fungal-specific transcription factor domain-containing protein [Zopfochytrium polystomum]
MAPVVSDDAAADTAAPENGTLDALDDAVAPPPSNKKDPTTGRRRRRRYGSEAAALASLGFGSSSSSSVGTPTRSSSSSSSSSTGNDESATEDDEGDHDKGEGEQQAQEQQQQQQQLFPFTKSTTNSTAAPSPVSTSAPTISSPPVSSSSSAPSSATSPATTSFSPHSTSESHAPPPPEGLFTPTNSASSQLPFQLPPPTTSGSRASSRVVPWRWSCETCRSRKTKCDGVRPACGFCVKRGIYPCTFLGNKTRVDEQLASKHRAQIDRRRRKMAEQQPMQTFDPALPMHGLSHLESDAGVDAFVPSVGSDAPKPDPGSSVEPAARPQKLPKKRAKKKTTGGEAPASIAPASLPSEGAKPVFDNVSKTLGEKELLPDPLPAWSVPPELDDLNSGEDILVDDLVDFMGDTETLFGTSGSLPPTRYSKDNESPTAGLNRTAGPDRRMSEPDVKSLVELISSFSFGLSPESEAYLQSAMKTLPKPPPMKSYRRPGASDEEERMLAETFFELPFPVSFVHRKTVLNNLEGTSPLLRMAICAVAAGLVWKPIMSQEDANWYGSKARQIAEEAIEDPSIENVQGFLIMGYTTLRFGTDSVGWQALGMACRMALYLRLDIDPDDLRLDVSWVEKETRRRCWAACYLFDRISAGLRGRVPIIKRDLASLPSLCREDIWRSRSDPDELLSQYLAHRSPSENLSNYIVRHAELVITSTELANPACLTADSDLLTVVEEAVHRQISRWVRGLPAQHSYVITGEWSRNSIEFGTALWDVQIGVFCGHHGMICALHHRRLKLYLHYLKKCLQSGATHPSLFASHKGGDNIITLHRSLEAVKTMARVFSFLHADKHQITRVPPVMLFFALEGLTTLIMIDAAAAALDALYESASSEIAARLPVRTVPTRHALTKIITDYLKFLHILALPADSIVAVNTFLAFFRVSGGKVLDDERETMRLASIAASEGSVASAFGLVGDDDDDDDEGGEDEVASLLREILSSSSETGGLVGSGDMEGVNGVEDGFMIFPGA